MALNEKSLVLCGLSLIYRCRRQFSEQPDIVVDDTMLQVTAKQKYFGLIFDIQLTWSGHVSLRQKMSYYLHLVGLHKCVLPVCLIKLLMDSLVLYNVQYALPDWGPSTYQHHIQRLQRFQNHAVHIFFKQI